MYFFDIESQLPSYNINIFIDPLRAQQNNTIFNSIQNYIHRVFYRFLQL
jgi:hypothetical protein